MWNTPFLKEHYRSNHTYIRLERVLNSLPTLYSARLRTESFDILY